MANPDDEIVERTRLAARVLVEAVKKNLRPSDIITRQSIENAVALIMAVGGSTNAVLHYLAIAHAAGVEWTIDDFERVRRKVPVFCDLKPSGKYVATDLHKAGGIPLVLRMLLDKGLLHGDCMTITGRTIAQELERRTDRPRQDPGRDPPIDKPMYAQGHLAILKGNLAPEGCVAKITGLKNPVITGPARVFDSEEAAMEAILADRIKPGDVVVIRYEGPQGGPGMREMLTPDLGADRQGPRRVGRPHHRRALLGRHLGHGGRPRGAGGLRRRQHRADRGRRRDHDRRAQAAAATERRRGRRSPRRRAAWKQPKPRYVKGVLAKFAKLASTASKGAITDEKLFG